jgi:hypothetical protein
VRYKAEAKEMLNTNINMAEIISLFLFLLEARVIP